MSSPLTMYYTSYAGNTGQWFQWYGLTAASNAAAAACQFGTGYPATQTNGVIYMLSAVGLQSVTDGTSNTMLSSERAHGKFPAGDLYCWNWWTSGNFGDTMFTTFFPMNPFNKIPDFCCLDSGPDAYVASAASFHPGGANFGFCDGSVKFLKDSVSSWQNVNTGSLGPIPGTQVSGGSAPARFSGLSRLPGRALSRCERWVRFDARYESRRLPGSVESQQRRGHQLRPVLSSVLNALKTPSISPQS